MDIIDDFLDKGENSVMMLFTEVFMPLLQQAKYLPSSEEQE